jgi:hypothetical protein
MKYKNDENINMLQELSCITHYIKYSTRICIAQWFYHQTACGKIATNRDKVMNSSAFAIFLIVQTTKNGDQKLYTL